LSFGDEAAKAALLHAAGEKPMIAKLDALAPRPLSGRSRSPARSRWPAGSAKVCSA